MKKSREEVALHYQQRDPAFQKFVKDQDLRIQACEELVCPAGPYIDNVHFNGCDLIFCKRGSFRITASNHDPVMLADDEAIAMFSGRLVSFEALSETEDNELGYAVIAGSFAEEYMLSLGFFDYAKTHCFYPTATIAMLQNVLETKDVTQPGPKTEALCIFNSMAHSVVEQARLEGNALLCDAIKAINLNVINGSCRIEPVCEELDISRTQLHRLFVRHGFNSAGAYMKSVQLNYALKLLRVSRLSIAEIAFRCGFASATQFSAFIRQRSGKSPSQHRGRD